MSQGLLLRLLVPCLVLLVTACGGLRGERPGPGAGVGPVPESVIVEAGDTVHGISRLYGIPAGEIIDLNGLEEPYIIRVGQRLRLPVTRGTAAEAPWNQGPTGSAPRLEPASAPPDGLPAPPPVSGAGFLWPLEGDILAGFGPGEDGRHNDGVNIAAAAGATVIAAENGTVTYAGNELRGFGNLVLIRHDGGWVTAYAHNARILVSRGDRVRRGQPIAEAGGTGNVGRPQLHFEIRQGTRAVDPLPLLVGGQSASGGV